MTRQPPNDRRNFVHKSILKFGASFVPGGGIALGIGEHLFSNQTQKRTGAAAKFPAMFETGGSRFAATPARRREITRAMNAAQARGDLAGAAAFRRELGSVGALGPAAAAPAVNLGTFGQTGLVAGPCPQTVPCRWPQRWDPVSCRCRIYVGPGSGPTPDPEPAGNGVVTEGGPFHHPPSHMHPVQPQVWADGSTRDGQRRRCPRRYKLGIDNLCYFNLPRNSKFRKWRPGRKPLFTGGDLNAIATAGKLAESAEEIFQDTNPAKKAVARNYRANWRKPLKK